MKAKKPDRRGFLRHTLGGASVAFAGAAAALPANGRSERGKASKKVIERAGEPSTPATILSPGIQFGDLLFVSGQGAHDPRTHKVVDGPFPNQVRQCLDNLKTVLEAAGSSLEKVLKCTVFLTDISNFQAMNQVYHQYFPAQPPARSTMAVKELPGESPVEIECIAYV